MSEFRFRILHALWLLGIPPAWAMWPRYSFRKWREDKRRNAR